MDRPAEEFVHQLPCELTIVAIVIAGPTYAHRSNAKRAAQRMIERVLDDF